MAMGDGVAVPVVAHLASEVLSPLAERCIEAREETRSVPAPMKAQRLAPFLAGVDQRIADWAGSAP
jgi:hypothetical protein